MCWICGALTHKGPDDEGVWVLDWAYNTSQRVRSNNMSRAQSKNIVRILLELNCYKV